MNVIPSRYETFPPNTESVLGLLQSRDEEKEDNEIKELNGKKQSAKNLYILSHIFSILILYFWDLKDLKDIRSRQFSMPLKLFSFRCTIVRSLKRKFQPSDLTNHSRTRQSWLQLTCDWLKKDWRLIFRSTVVQHQCNGKKADALGFCLHTWMNWYRACFQRTTQQYGVQCCSETLTKEERNLKVYFSHHVSA